MMSRTRTTVVTVVAVFVLLIVISILLPSLPRREPPHRYKCASNLRQIGQAMVLYANENGQSSADSFATLLRTQDLVPDVFVCPTSGAKRAAGIDAFAADPGPAHSGYVYLGDRLPMRFNVVPAEAILAIERTLDPGHAGVNVLYGDGHVEFMDRAYGGKPTPWWDAVQDQIARGVRPVMMPAAATQPAR